MVVPLSGNLFPFKCPPCDDLLGDHRMKMQNGPYVRFIVKKAPSGKLTTGQADARLGISKQCFNRLTRALFEKGEGFLIHENKRKP